MTEILKDIQLKGKLDYAFVCHLLQNITGSQTAYFFQMLTEKFVCKFSSNPEYAVGDVYTFDELPDPETQFLLYQGPDLIAIMIAGELDKADLPDSALTALHNVLSLGVIMTRSQDSMVGLQLSVCSEVGQLLSSVLQLVDSTPALILKKPGATRENFDVVRDHDNVLYQNMQRMTRSVTQAFSLILDVRDYLQLMTDAAVLGEEDFVFRELLQEVVDTFQEQGQRSINVTVGDSIPRVVRCSRSRLRQILLSVMQKLSDSGSINIAAERQASEGLDGFTLQIRFRTAIRVEEWFTYETVTSRTLTTALTKQLCSQLHGHMTMDDDGLGVQVRVRCELSNATSIFQQKQILICVTDPVIQGQLFSLFGELNAVPTLSGPDPSLYYNHIERFHLVLCDSSFRSYVPRVRKRGVPVIGILTPSPQDRSLQFSNLFDSTTTQPFNPDDISAKARQLLEGPNRRQM